MPPQPQTMHVRLKPYNPKKGHLIRRYTYRGVRIIGARGWYRVRKDVADYLAGVRATPGDEDTPLAFDVVSEDEAKKIDAEERKARERRHAAGDAIDASEAAVAPEPRPRRSRGRRS